MIVYQKRSIQKRFLLHRVAFIFKMDQLQALKLYTLFLFQYNSKVFPQHPIFKTQDNYIFLSMLLYKVLLIPHNLYSNRLYQ